MTLQIPSIKLYDSKYVGHDVLATRTRACLLTMCSNLGVCKSEFLQNRTNLAMSVRRLKSHLTDQKKSTGKTRKRAIMIRVSTKARVELVRSLGLNPYRWRRSFGLDVTVSMLVSQPLSDGQFIQRKAGPVLELWPTSTILNCGCIQIDL